jgi:hypothetical protein
MPPGPLYLVEQTGGGRSADPEESGLVEADTGSGDEAETCPMSVLNGGFESGLGNVEGRFDDEELAV